MSFISLVFFALSAVVLIKMVLSIANPVLAVKWFKQDPPSNKIIRPILFSAILFGIGFVNLPNSEETAEAKKRGNGNKP